MNFINSKQDKHLTQIVNILSMYQTLLITQIEKLYPELSKEKLLLLIRRLEKSGRLIYIEETGLLKYSKDSEFNLSLIKSFWILLDFRSEMTYHTISDFPVILTFYTPDHAYDIVHIQRGNEVLISHALSSWCKEDAHRLVIIDFPEQIPLLQFPGIAAYCTVNFEGEVNYYKKQGVNDS